MTTVTPKLDAMRVAEVIAAEFAPRRHEPIDQLRAELEERIDAEVAAHVPRYRARGLSERRTAAFANTLRHHARRALALHKRPRFAGTAESLNLTPASAVPASVVRRPAP